MMIPEEGTWPEGSLCEQMARLHGPEYAYPIPATLPTAYMCSSVYENTPRGTLRRITIDIMPQFTSPYGNYAHIRPDNVERVLAALRVTVLEYLEDNRMTRDQAERYRELIEDIDKTVSMAITDVDGANTQIFREYFADIHKNMIELYKEIHFLK